METYGFPDLMEIHPNPLSKSGSEMYAANKGQFQSGIGQIGPRIRAWRLPYECFEMIEIHRELMKIDRNPSGIDGNR